MKLCMPHWNELRDKIIAHGMQSLVAKTGRDAHARVVDGLENGGKPTNFDPLMSANNMIWSNALSVGGLGIMADNEDGTERCPICWLVASCPCGRGDACPFLTWTTRAADDAKAQAINLGLVGTDAAPSGGDSR